MTPELKRENGPGTIRDSQTHVIISQVLKFIDRFSNFGKVRHMQIYFKTRDIHKRNTYVQWNAEI